MVLRNTIGACRLRRPFGMDTFVALKTQLGLARAMLVAYLAGRRL